MSEHTVVGDSIRDVPQLEQLLSEPTDGVVQTMRRLEGDILILGVSGKIGPTLARMAKRASDAVGIPRRIIGGADVFPNGLEAQLTEHGIETIQCDLLDTNRVAELPDVANLVYMVGMKFGTTGKQAMTWAVNTAVPTIVAQRYRGCRIVVFSTGNVYGLSSVDRGGSRETDELNPLGEYANSALGRERIFEHYSRALGTPTAIVRLNYAVEMRYGVLVDVARAVWEKRPIDLAMGYANVIWQADASAMTLRALAQVAVPPAVFNIAGQETLSIREVSQQFGAMMGKKPIFSGKESSDALLSNGALGRQHLGHPRVDVERMMRWIADWVMRGGEYLGKPTHFESRDGKF